MPASGLSSGVTFCGLLLFAYLLGSIPWGLILSRIFAREDIRLKGSGNIGATNVLRQIGVIPGLLTLAGDIVKGALPVYLALKAFGPVGGAGRNGNGGGAALRPPRKLDTHRGIPAGTKKCSRRKSRRGLC